MLGVTGTGEFAHMPEDRVARAQVAFEKRVAQAAKFNRHVWITTVAHSMTDKQARAVLDGTAGDQLLDVETVAVTGIGCYRCEQALTAELIDAPCDGDPADRVSEVQVLEALRLALRAGDQGATTELLALLDTVNPQAAREIRDSIRRAQ